MGSMNSHWLTQLAPPHAPPPPGWWPVAPGWWVLALLLLLGTGTLLYWFGHPSRQLSRAALHELKQLENSVDDTELAIELESLLRRYALAVYGREAVANLSGDSWLTFVAAKGGAELTGETGRNLLRAAYGGHADIDRARWLKGARNFLRQRK